MNDLKDRVAVVTGAGRKGGIGEAVARRLAREGAHVVVGDVCASPSDLPHAGSGQWEELCAIAGEIESLGVQTLPVRIDVTDAASVQAMIAKIEDVFGRLDILVNNAGTVIGPAPVVQMAEEAWRRTVEINATGTYLCCKFALPLMIGGGQGGRIINMSSLAAERPKPYTSAYAASKAAVVALTRSLAQEVAEFDITVNAVLPGTTNTGMAEAAMADPEWTRQITEGIPVKRLGETRDLLGAVLFFASSESDYCTGQTLIVDGGYSMI